MTHSQALCISPTRVIQPRVNPTKNRFMKFRAVTGMNDILPEEARGYQFVEAKFRAAVEAYGFRELRTPLVEELGLFHKSTGETSEVVQKQMFLLAKEGESLALRPEGTPSAARVYIGNKMHAREPVTKWFYIGPMFRAERPQRGRYRQFHQAGCELYGDAGPICDAEIIDMLYRFAADLGLAEVKVLVNTLGGPEARAAYRQRLVEYFEPLSAQISEHAQARLLDNPLRILDSKDVRDQEASKNAPVLLDCLTEDDRAHWEGLLTALDRLGTPYEIDSRLVRGLDYYTRTCFEVVTTSGNIGSQSAILGGGRYDGMLQSLGGQETPAIGFAMGIERVLLALGESSHPEAPLCFIAPMGQIATLSCLQLAARLRAAGIWTELDARGNSLKSMLRRADGMGAFVCLVMGESEAEQGLVQLKNLKAHTQSNIAQDDVVTQVKAALGQSTHSGRQPASKSGSST